LRDAAREMFLRHLPRFNSRSRCADVVHVYAGGKCSKKEVAFAVQTASLIAMRERNHGKSARIEMVDQDGEEEGQGGAFWAAVSGTREGVAATRVGGGEGVAGWEEPVLYRLDDLQEQLEVTQVGTKSSKRASNYGSTHPIMRRASCRNPA